MHAHEHGGRSAAVTAFGPRVQAVVTHGVHGLTAAEMDCMPQLSINCSVVAWRPINVSMVLQALYRRGQFHSAPMPPSGRMNGL